MKTKEERADNYTRMQYIDYGDLSYQAEEQIREAFLAGFLAKEEIIEDLIEKLELTKLKPTEETGSMTASIKLYNEEQDRRINLLKILL